MINKQNLWFLTLFSLILVLSIYYITMPSDLLLAASTSNKVEEDENDKEEATISDASNLTALRVSKEEERDEEKEELESTMTNEEATTDEKNKAYEQLKYLNEVEGLEEKLEKKIKSEFKLDSFVKIDNNEIKIVCISKTHDNTLANNIMRKIQEEFKERKNITVKFEK